METRETNSTLKLTGRIDRRTHDVAELQEAYPDWNNLTHEEKLEASRSVEPKTEETVYNVTVDGLHEYFVDNLDPSQTAAKDNITTLWLALGDDAGSGTTQSDTDLNARQYSEVVTDVADNGKELLTSTFLDSTEANTPGVYDELGLFSGDPANLANADVFMLNHATFADVTKDASKTVTFDVTLTFSDV